MAPRREAWEYRRGAGRSGAVLESRRRWLCVLLLTGGCAALAEDLASDREPRDGQPLPITIIPTAPTSRIGDESGSGGDAIDRPAVDDEGCVIDIPAHAVDHWHEVSEDPVRPQDLAPSPLLLPDVDGDDQPDPLVYAPYACGVTGNCPALVYLSGNGCTTYAGGLWFDWESETVLAGRHHGVRDLQVFLEGARGDPECGGMKGRIERWHWDGRRYALARTIRCPCPDDRSRARLHRACPGWSASERQ